MGMLPPKNAAAPEPDMLDGSRHPADEPVVWGRVTPDAESLGATQPHTPDGTHEVMAARGEGLPHDRTFVSDEAGPPIMIRTAVTPRPGQRVAPASLVKLVERSAPRKPKKSGRENPIRRRLNERRRAITRRSQAKSNPLRQLQAPAAIPPPSEPERAKAKASAPEPKAPPTPPAAARSPKPAQKERAAAPPTPAPTNAFRPDGAPTPESAELQRHRKEVEALRSQLRRTLDEVDFWRRGMILSLLLAGGAATAFFWPF